MAKYRYSAQVDCRRGDTTTSKNLEFIADESAFRGTSAIKDLNKVALRFVKNQNGGEIVGYSKVEVRGFSKIGTVNNSSKSNYISKNKRKLSSYNILLLPFIIIWRILNWFIKFLDRIL